ncbi:MAG: methyltransferase family protein [Promethearchaeota archaeon]
MISIPWANLIFLNITMFFCWYFYILSVQPVSRSEKYGEKAWQDCKRFRAISGILMGVITINFILWIWFPIPELAWFVHPIHLVSIVIGVIIAIIFTPIWIKGIKDAGPETMIPAKTTQLYGGIYKHIRHPQAVGEMPWFVIIPLFINSLFLVIWAIIMVIIVSPIIIHYEEKDLIKRFGEEYREYQKKTGAIFPKLRKPKD